MNVDKDLFLYDLVVVAIMKNEAPYVKEWLDYHLLAGVNHFYIYDNESDDNLKEILQPYISAGLVTHIFYPGKMIQTPAYNDAIDKFKFYCRYMAFIDADEFILPISRHSITPIVDEVFFNNPNAAVLAINWQYYGSNGLKKADFSKGVLERFTRRAPKNFTHIEPGYSDTTPAGNAICKPIINPRKVKGMFGPHHAICYEKCFIVNENGKVLQTGNNFPVTADKIAVNHYRTKTPEEYLLKVNRGNTDLGDKKFYTDYKWKLWDLNDEFDDTILRYRDKKLREINVINGDFIGTLASANRISYMRIFSAIMMNVQMTFPNFVPREFLKNKLETFLTCRAVASQMKAAQFLDDNSGKILEEAALNAILKTLSTDIQLHELRLMISALPDILDLNYPIVKDILKSCITVLKNLSYVYQKHRFFADFADTEYLCKLLTKFDYDKTM